MVIDVFELLTKVHESIASNIAAIEARRDFFLNEVDLQTAIIGDGARQRRCARENRWTGDRIRRRGLEANP